jgi:hypothetical protein
MQALALREEDRRTDAEARGQAGVALSQRPEEKIDEESDLSREAGILLCSGDIGGDRRESDDPQRHRGHSDAPDAIAQPAEESDERESPDPRRAALRSPTLPPLALNPKQQPDAERDEQTDRRIAQRSHHRQPAHVISCVARQDGSDIRRH